MRLKNRFFLAVGVWLAVSCGTDDPTRVDRPPVVQGFTPSDQVLETSVGDTLVFTIRAIDPDQGDLRQHFSLDDSLVSNASSWKYVVADSGTASVECIVTNGRYDSRITWRLHRRIAVNFPPVIVTFAPTEPSPAIIIGNTIDFAVQASDPDGDSLSYFYTVNDTIMSHDSEYTYQGQSFGRKDVRAVVTDGEFFVVQKWDLKVTSIPDTVPPALVEMPVAVTGAEPGEVYIEWIAVGRDGMDGLASEYLVRTAPTPILSEDDWSRASRRPGVPAPKAPGETMAMVLDGLIPARFTHVTVRAADDFGNLSPLGVSPGVYTRGMRVTGNVINAVTGQPVEGITVQLAHFETLTDAAGNYEFIELPPVEGNIGLIDEFIGGSVGAYYNYRRPYVIVHNDVVQLYALPNRPLATSEYLDFYQFYRLMTDIGGIPFETEQRRWDLPVDIYVPPFSLDGLDYGETIKDVVREFDALMGRSVFNLVDGPPDKGVFIIYSDQAPRDIYSVTQWTSDYYPVKGRITFRERYNASTMRVLQIVARHELGHALGLNHSQDTRHIMVGGQTPGADFFSDDELAVLHAFYNIPQGFEKTDFLPD